MADRRLFFLHVPKTAGVSITRYLRRHFAADEACVITDPDYLGEERRIAGLPIEVRNRFGLVAGHFPYGFHEVFPPAESIYFCLLRDPFERVASLHRYIIATPKHHLHARVVGEGMDLATFAASGIHPELDNCQTRMLSGRAASHWWAGEENCTAEDRDRALARIADPMFVWGLFERLPEAMALLDRRLGWAPAHLERKNATSAGEQGAELTLAERKAIEANNGFDIEIYRAAVNRFRSDWRRVDLLRRAKVFLGSRLAMRGRLWVS